MIGHVCCLVRSFLNIRPLAHWRRAGSLRVRYCSSHCDTGGLAEVALYEHFFLV